MIRAVLCDIGNVLVTFDFRAAVERIAMEADLSPDELGDIITELMPDHETGRMTSDDFVAALITRSRFRGSSDSLGRIYCDIFKANEPAWDLMDALRTCAPVHLFSNTSRLHEEHLFANYPVFSRIDGGFYSWRVGSMKPSREFYDAAVKTLGFTPQEIVYLDDSLPNLDAGRELGIHAIRYDARFPETHAEAVAELAALGLPVK